MIDSGSDLYCIGEQACISSTINSVGNIICGSLYSCQNAVVFSAADLLCLNQRSCWGITVRKVQRVYMIEFQQDVTIYSGNSGNQDVEIWFFFATSSDVTVYCQANDACAIKCDKYSCSNIVLYCDGLCDIDCPEDSLVGCGITISSSSPTGAPTNPEVLLTEEDVSVMFNWVISCAAGLTLAILMGGMIHASKKYCGPRNELFNWQAVVIAVLYCNDFISDLFFSLRLSVIAFDGFEEKQNYLKPFFVLFVLSVIFIVFPFIFNLIQLNKEIPKWSQDLILKETCVSNWLMSNAKKLYFMAVISGSSFSAIGFCNSYLFKLNAFSMGLSNYHRSQFQNKRFFSVVLLEVYQLYFFCLNLNMF